MILEIFNLIKTISTNHLMVKSFNYGDGYNLDKVGDEEVVQFYLEYPFNIQYVGSKKTISFSYYLLDIPNEGQSDDIELLSKLEQINEDILMRLQLREYEEFQTIENINSLTLNEFQGNNSVAIRTEITLSVVRDSNSCFAPWKS